MHATRTKTDSAGICLRLRQWAIEEAEVTDTDERPIAAWWLRDAADMIEESGRENAGLREEIKRLRALLSDLQDRTDH